jgi:hypothetical protein
LSLTDAGRIISGIKPAVAILTHFGMSLWKEGGDIVSDRLAQETGVRVIGARDGMTFNLNTLNVIDRSQD